jgi:hypothetical protein
MDTMYQEPQITKAFTYHRKDDQPARYETIR